MGKGGSGEIQETEAQRAAADVANDQWNLYNNDLKQYEDLFMDKVENLNSGQQYDKLAGTAALGTAQSFGKARQGLADSMAAGGVDPTSGKYQSAMGNLETEQALSQADTTNRAQTSQQDKYVAGLKDVVSLGAGQKADALAGMGDVANSSLRKAENDAQDAFNNSQAEAGLAGALGGAAFRKYGLSDTKSPDPKSMEDDWTTSRYMNNGTMTA